MLLGARDAKNTQHSTDRGTISSHGPLAHICTSKCAAESPTPAAAAARENFSTELALLADCGAHKKQKTRSSATAGHCLWDNLISKLISALLNVPLGALR